MAVPGTAVFDLHRCSRRAKGGWLLNQLVGSLWVVGFMTICRLPLRKMCLARPFKVAACSEQFTLGPSKNFLFLNQNFGKKTGNNILGECL